MFLHLVITVFERLTLDYLYILFQNKNAPFSGTLSNYNYTSYAFSIIFNIFSIYASVRDCGLINILK